MQKRSPGCDQLWEEYGFPAHDAFWALKDMICPAVPQEPASVNASLLFPNLEKTCYDNHKGRERLCHMILKKNIRTFTFLQKPHP